VGFYADTSSNGQALIETESGGTWTAQKPSFAGLPSVYSAAPYAELSAVSCTTVGNCVAVGEYEDAAQATQGLVETETNGTWAAAKLPLAGLPSLYSDPGVTLASLSCPSAGNCVAVGHYYDAANHEQALIATETNGSWSAHQADLSSLSTYSDPYGMLTEVACASPGNCAAIGSYRDAADDDDGLIETESGGTWTTSRPNLTMLPSVAAGPRDFLDGLSCPAAGSCTASGKYLDGSANGGSYQGMLLSQSSGVWAPAAEAKLPADANLTPSHGNPAQGGLYLGSVACVSAGNCTVVGAYGATSSNAEEALAITETNGSWATGVGIGVPAGAASNPQAALTSVSCRSGGSCTAAGTYAGSDGHYYALVAQEAGGDWATAGVQQPTQTGLFDIGAPEISCTASGYCATAGGTLSGVAPNPTIAFLFDAPDVTSTPTASLSGPTQATVAWNAPANNGGLPVTGYTVTATDLTDSARGGQTVTASGSSTSAMITGLAPGDSYTFTVSATSLLGTGLSATSASMTVPPSESQIAASLSKLLVPTGSTSRLKKLRRTHGYTFTYDPLESGKVTIRWYQISGHGKHRHKHLVASGSATTTGTSAVTVHVRLTALGRRLVRADRTLRLTSSVTFVSGSTTVTRTRAFTLR
jgi:hypothetical protein